MGVNKNSWDENDPLYSLALNAKIFKEKKMNIVRRLFNWLFR
jgi:hypothetical protein